MHENVFFVVFDHEFLTSLSQILKKYGISHTKNWLISEIRLHEIVASAMIRNTLRKRGW